MLYRLYLALLKKFGRQHWWPAQNEEEIIIGAILTQNTNWNNVEKAIQNLKAKNKCSIKDIAKLPLKDLEILIKSSGFYRQKAKRLKNVCSYLIKNYGNNFIAKLKNKKTLELRNELLNLKGIGKETADSILLYAFKRPIFVIDNYTRRIYEAIKDNDYNAFKIEYDKLREIFEKELEKYCKTKNLTQIYNEYHALIVRFGKTYSKHDYKRVIKTFLNKR